MLDTGSNIVIRQGGLMCIKYTNLAITFNFEAVKTICYWKIALPIPDDRRANFGKRCQVADHAVRLFSGRGLSGGTKILPDLACPNQCREEQDLPLLTQRQAFGMRNRVLTYRWKQASS